MRSLLVATLLLAACKPLHHPHPDGIDAPALFHGTCSQCHGDDGHGRTEVGRSVGAKDLTRSEAKQMTGADIAHQIKVGKGKMPAFGNMLDEEEIEALVDHVRRLN